MKLFQRIRRISTELSGSASKLASRLHLPQTTLNGYLSEKRENNLWPLLPQILEIYPQISRDWLYFGEGEMLLTQGYGLQAVATPLKTVAHAPVHDAEKDTRIRMLEQEISELRKELLEDKRKIVALYEQQAQAQGVFSTLASGAPTTSGVAP